MLAARTRRIIARQREREATSEQDEWKCRRSAHCKERKCNIWRAEKKPTSHPAKPESRMDDYGKLFTRPIVAFGSSRDVFFVLAPSPDSSVSSRNAIRSAANSSLMRVSCASFSLMTSLISLIILDSPESSQNSCGREAQLEHIVLPRLWAWRRICNRHGRSPALRRVIRPVLRWMSHHPVSCSGKSF